MIQFSGRNILGAFLILLGLTFLLRELGFIQLDVILKFWPVALVVAGCLLLFGWGKNR